MINLSRLRPRPQNSPTAQRLTWIMTLVPFVLAGCGSPHVSVLAPDGGASDQEPPANGTDSGISDSPDEGTDGLAPTTTGPAAISASPLLDNWPLITPGVQSRTVSSYDRMGGNDDGFAGTYSTLYLLPSGEHVILDAFGPGRLNTLWFTSGDSGFGKLTLGKIRFYIDGEQIPRAEVDANELFSGRTVGFPPDLVFDNTISTGGYVSWVRVPFANRLIITTERQPFFYSAQYDSFPTGTDIRSWSVDQKDESWSSVFASANAPWDEPGPNGQPPAGLTEVPLTYLSTGSGVIDAIVFQPAAPPSAADLRQAHIRLTWDDEQGPSVDAPMDMFFGSGLGETPVRSVAFRMAPGMYQNHFPMPFWKGFHMEIVGLDGKVQLRISPQRFTVGRAGYFRAIFHDVPLTSQPDDFVYTSLSGAGKLAGTVLAVEPPNPANDKRWWEGDLRSYADDRQSPDTHGTGHEDDYFGGWSNEYFSGPFSLPMHGEPKTEIFDRNGQYNGNVTMYRLWPGIPFLKQIDHSVEHGSGNSSAVHYSSLTFLYSEPQPWLVQTDLLRVCDDSDRLAHAYSATKEGPRLSMISGFEGRFFQATVSACAASESGPTSFSVAVNPANAGVLLRRMFDQLRGPQQAMVTVDGQPVGTWYSVETNGVLRWAERDFFLPPQMTSGKSQLSIKIEPSGSEPPVWNAAEYRALSVVAPP